MQTRNGGGRIHTGRRGREMTQVIISRGLSPSPPLMKRTRGRNTWRKEREVTSVEGRWAPGGQDQGHYLDGLIAMQKLTMANGMIGVCVRLRVQVAFCPLSRRPA